MGSLENPKTWVPYMINTKDCSQGFCSLYCPQWCNIIFPPPPPFEFPNEHRDSKFSPLVVALIGILASAFLLVSYYIIMSKYCKNGDSSIGREEEDPNPIDESLGNQDSPPHEASQQAPLNSGLDEALIKSITMFKYKKEVGFIEATDCSVCLSEFQENESLRLLPKCSHAFHKTCIDTWLKSHSNCPLCRANIVFVNSLTPQLSPVLEPPEGSSSQTSQEEEDIEMGIQEMDLYPNNPAETPSRHVEDSDFVTSIGVMKNKEGERIRRSMSMNDCVSHGHLSIADVLHIEQCPNWDGGETSKQRPVVAKSRRFCGNGVVQCAAAGCAGVRMSISSERFMLSNVGKGRNMSIPL